MWEKEGVGKESHSEEDPSDQSFVGRVAHGVPDRVDRIKCFGNAVVAQVAEAIGRCIVRFDRRHTHQFEG
jgi:hypothetical protein